MKFEKTKSSYIQGVAYDEAAKKLQVKFKNDVVWEYYDVPVAAHVSLLLAESTGKFFAKEIKGVFTGRKLEPEDESE